jgi:DNA-binding response OmpR family regulator
LYILSAVLVDLTMSGREDDVMNQHVTRQDFRHARLEDCVLIIEDDRAANDELAEFIESMGFQTYQEFDGDAGLALIRRLQPKVVLIDVQMPKMSGVEVVRVARANFPDMSLVLMSGAPQAELERLTADGDKVIILEKPLPLEALREFLRLTFRK